MGWWEVLPPFHAYSVRTNFPSCFLPLEDSVGTNSWVSERSPVASWSPEWVESQNGTMKQEQRLKRSQWWNIPFVWTIQKYPSVQQLLTWASNLGRFQPFSLGNNMVSVIWRGTTESLLRTLFSLNEGLFGPKLFSKDARANATS